MVGRWNQFQTRLRDLVESEAWNSYMVGRWIPDGEIGGGVEMGEPWNSYVSIAWSVLVQNGDVCRVDNTKVRENDTDMERMDEKRVTQL